MNNTVLIRYHNDKLTKAKWNPKGDFVDLRCAEDNEYTIPFSDELDRGIQIQQGEHKLISLGVSMTLPPGYYAELVPRSSLFKKYGLLMTNSPGIIDESYCGDNDIWYFSVYSTRNTFVPFDERICQFRIVKKEPFEINTVYKLVDENRGATATREN